MSAKDLYVGLQPLKAGCDLSGTMNIGAASCCVYTQLPTQRCPGCFSCFGRVPDIFAKEALEILGQHTWRTSFDNIADIGSEANAAEARQASHAGQHDIDDQPFDVIVCTLRHDEMSN